jgi:protein-S-isoprenylcysteine O-methyltransferase Ste14
MRRIFFFFGVLSHLMFLLVFAYMAGFVGNLMVPKSIDSPVVGGSMWAAIMLDMFLLALFTVPHSVMARPTFKRWWTKFVPAPVERSVYVFTSNVLMIALLYYWRPIDLVIYDLDHPVVRAAMWAMFALGWALVPAASLMINHFDLFGTRQVWHNLQNKACENMPFRTPWLYRFVRHPLYVGWMIAFWATPTMTAGHMLFAALMTAYMLIAIPLEERNLVEHFGDKYVDYRNRVGALIPRLPAQATQPDTATELN